MIIDEIPLAGEEAYLRGPGGQFNLGGAQPSGGRYGVGSDGVMVNVGAIDLHIVTSELTAMFSRQSQPLFSVHVVKEMFPGLFADPYRNRVHSIAGFDDFKRGQSDGVVAMDVDGVPTLVSLGDGDVWWQSPIYPLADATDIDDVAWDLAASRTGYEDAFRYTLRLEVWRTAGLDANPDETIDLADDALPSDQRVARNIGAKRVRAYRVFFKASISHDASLHQAHVAASAQPTLGRPLLRAVNLLEPMESPHDFYSLHEVQIAGGELSIIDSGREEPQVLTASLDVTAALTFRETVALSVHVESFDVFEARLSATIIERPPVTHRDG